MTLSMPSIAATPLAPASPGFAPASGGAKVAGGFLDDFLASLAQDEPTQVPGILPTATVTAPRDVADPLPVVTGQAMPVAAPAEAALPPVSLPAPAQPVIAAPADPALAALPPAPAGLPDGSALPEDAASAEEFAVPAQDADLPETVTPAVVAPETVAPPRPKAVPKGAPAEPAPALEKVDQKRGASDAVPVVASPTQPAEPAPVAIPAAQGGPGEKGAAPQDGPHRPVAAAQVSGGERQASAPAAQRAAPPPPVPPAPALAAALPDVAPVAAPAPVTIGEPAPQPVALQSTPAAPVVAMDRVDWPQTVVSSTLAGLSADGGTMTMEISPEELGTLRITLTLEGDTATVQIETATPEAARLLNDAERQLSQDFARQGVTLASHDAQTGRRGDQGPRTLDHAPPRTGDEDLPPTPVALLRPLGTINLIA